MKTKDIFEKNFPGAEIEWIGLGSYRINTRTGFIEYDGKKFTHPVGGADLYRGIAQSMKDMGYTSMTVDGSEQHIVASMAAGAEVGIDVIPEIGKKTSGCLTLLSWFVMFAVCKAIAGVWLGDAESSFAGFAAATVLMVFWGGPILDKRAEREARLRGQIYRNTLPDVHGHQRFYEP